MNKKSLVAVLDTNVVYPLTIRDFLLWLAWEKLFVPKWSRHIFDEWETVMKRKGMGSEEITRILQRVRSAFPSAEVRGYEPLIERFTLPDEKDRHILAVAYHIKADVIVTNNSKDFPKTYLADFAIQSQTADDFIMRVITSNEGKAVAAFQDMVFSKRKPKVTEVEMLKRLEKAGLSKTVDYLQPLL